MSAGTDGERLATFLDAVEKLPPYPGVTFRGCAAGADFVRPRLDDRMIPIVADKAEPPTP